MMQRRIGTRAPLILLIAVAALAAGCGGPTVGKQLAGVGNFGKVQRRDDPHALFYRGNQPTERGIETLKRAGVKTVINLRDDFDPREERWVRDAGMDYVLIKTSCRDIQPLQIATFLGKMRSLQKDEGKWPVFVHCKYGRDRTGLYVAVWRIVEEGWDREAAIDEMISYGHSPGNPMACPALVPYLRRFDASQFRAAR